MTSSERAAREASLAVSTPRSAWSSELRALTVGLILTVTLVALEALAVATIMPRVAHDLGGIALYGWVFSAFFLGNLVGIVVAGELVDRRGLLVPFGLGLALFGIGLVVGGLAPFMTVLVVGRAIQGAGAGAIPAVAYVAIGREYPIAIRPKMFAYLSSAWVVPGLVGPALAGVVGDTLGWRAVFLGLIPFVAVAAVLTVPSIRGVRAVAPDTDTPAPGGRAGDDGTRVSGQSPGTVSRPAGLGRVLLAVRVAAGSSLVLAALGARDPLAAAGLAAIGLVVGFPALRRLLPRGTLTARPGLPLTVLLRGVLTFAFTGAEAYLPLTLVSIRGTSASVAGLALTAATISWTAGAWIQAHGIGRWGAPRLIRAGFTLLAAGILAITAVLDRDVPVVVAVVGWGIAGLGMGLSYAPTTLTVLALAPPGEQGVSTAGLQLSDVLGTALGAGAGGAVIALAAASRWDPRLGLLLAFAIAVATGLLGLALAFRLRVPRSH